MRHRPRALAVAALVACGGALVASPSSAQPRIMPVQMGHIPTPDQPSRTLRSYVGLDAAKALLVSDEPGAHVRGVERLGTSSDPQAVDALIAAFDTGTAVSRDLEARLMAVRYLADHVDRADVRTHLARELTFVGVVRGASNPGALVRGAAALALARSGDDESIAALFHAIDQHGIGAEAALAALLAFPPRTLDPVLFVEVDTPDAPDDSNPDDDAAEIRDLLDKTTHAKAPKLNEKKPEPAPKKKPVKKPRVLGPSVIECLGALGDVRAIDALRDALASSQVQTRAAAAVALARFGDASAVPNAQKWSLSEVASLVEASARTLVLLDDWSTDSVAPIESAQPKPVRGAKVAPQPAKNPDEAVIVDAAKLKEPAAVRAVRKLLSLPNERRLAFELLAETKSPTKFKALSDDLHKIIDASDPDERAAATLALGRIGGADEWVKLLADDGASRAAAYAMATSGAPSVDAALEKALHGATGDARRLVVRAAIIRAVALGRATPGLSGALETLARSKAEADVETAAFGKVALGASPADVIGDLQHPVVAVVAGAARGALLRGPDDLAVFGKLVAGALDGQAPSMLHVAAGVGLLTEEGRLGVPQKTLLAWAEGGGPLAPLAAMALPARDDDDIRPRLRALLLDGTDSVIRASLALGFAVDPEPSSVSLLAEAYLTDPSALVRRAAIRALGARPEHQRERVLVWAADLDADASVRAEATEVLRKLRLGQSRAEGANDLGRRTLPMNLFAVAPSLTLTWTRIETTAGPPVAVAARFLRPDGLAVPVVSAADGDLIVPTLPFGASALDVTAPPAPVAAPSGHQP